MKYLAHSAKGSTPPQSYPNHVNNVRRGARRSFNSIKKQLRMSPECIDLALEVLDFVALYHDLGKLIDPCQRVLGGTGTKMPHHDDAGVALLLRRYRQTGNDVYRLAAEIVNAHHNYFEDSSDVYRYLSGPFGSSKSVLKPDALRDLGPVGGEVDVPFKTLAAYTDEELDRIEAIHDKISVRREARFFSAETIKEFERNRFVNMRLVLSVVANADHEDTALNYGNPFPRKTFKLSPRRCFRVVKGYIKSLSRNNSSDERHKIRCEFSRECMDAPIANNHEVIDGVVGVGKTLGCLARALRVASEKKKSGVITVIPYISLVDQTSDAYLEALNGLGPKFGEDFVSAIHSMVESDTYEAHLFTRGFSAPVNVTTAVNFFKVAIGSRMSSVANFWKLAGSVIVLDEYHAMVPTHLMIPAIRLLKEMSDSLGCHIIYSSGTSIDPWFLAQDCCREQIVRPSKILTGSLYRRMINLEKKRVTISDAGGLSIEQLAKRVLAKDTSVFVVLNTIKKTSAFYDYLKRVCQGSRPIYIRTSYIDYLSRAKVYQKIRNDLAAGLPVIFVATMGCDVGLNVSFHHGFREWAPFSSILQTLGRINRQDEFSDSTLVLFDLTDKIYEGIELYENPAIVGNKHLAKKYFESGSVEFSPEFCAEVFEDECNHLNKEQLEAMREMDMLYRDCEFKTLAEKFVVISDDSIQAIIDPAVVAAIRRGDKVPNSVIQSVSLNMHPSKAELETWISDGTLSKIDSGLRGTLYEWTGNYVPDGMGAAAHIFR